MSIFELQPYKKIDSVENWFCVKIPVFPSFFFVFLDFFENCWKMFTFYLYNAPRIFTFPSETTPELCCTQTQKKKKTYIIVKSIHSSLRSESKKNNNNHIISGACKLRHKYLFLCKLRQKKKQNVENIKKKNLSLECFFVDLNTKRDNSDIFSTRNTVYNFQVFGHTKSYIIRINLIVSNVVKNTLWINNTINRTVNIKNVPTPQTRPTQFREQIVPSNYNLSPYRRLSSNRTLQYFIFYDTIFLLAFEVQILTKIRQNHEYLNLALNFQGSFEIIFKVGSY
ncbi:hypothetical protein AGLY_007006 [Aphis glycines]|uniref:Uncharacterized protein n=1 Tax=Aphis glycines TaxID=307491 RepID=A0A6G0TPG6_APHGL|nr:hypothetical protein AGLY_007006 [Aphis glycines]